MHEKNECYACAVCGKKFPLQKLTPGGVIRDAINQEILQDFPQWSTDSYICHADLTLYRVQYVHSLLKSEKGEVTALELEVIRSMQQQELITKNTEDELEQQWSFGERLADKIATFGGSWPFLICFAIFLVI